MKLNAIESYLLSFVLCFFTLNAEGKRNAIKTITSFPEQLSKNCRDGKARLYDECSNQAEILNKALTTAKAEDKRVLVVFGEEWCIWCHVFERYIHGKTKNHHYVWRESEQNGLVQWKMNEKIEEATKDDAIVLNNYVADNFVIAHIEGEYTNGRELIFATGVDKQLPYYYPFIFSLDSNGDYANHMSTVSSVEGLEIRKSGGDDYRGYDRKILLEELKKLREQAE